MKLFTLEKFDKTFQYRQPCKIHSSPKNYTTKVAKRASLVKSKQLPARPYRQRAATKARPRLAAADRFHFSPRIQSSCKLAIPFDKLSSFGFAPRHKRTCAARTVSSAALARYIYRRNSADAQLEDGPTKKNAINRPTRKVFPA